MRVNRNEKALQAVHRARRFSAFLTIGSAAFLVLYSLNRMLGFGLTLDPEAAAFAALTFVIAGVFWMVGNIFAKASTATWVDGE